MLKTVFFIVVSWSTPQESGFRVYNQNPLTFDQCINAKMIVEEELYQDIYKVECREYIVKE